MIAKIREFILHTVPEPPAVAIVLGSGLADFSNQLNGVTRLPYAKIPGYPLPSVSGHVGEFAFGYIGSLPVLCARGRFHYYEGHPLATVTLPIRVFEAVGCSSVILTNAAGCLRPEWSLGDLMVITAHLDFTFRTSVQDPPVLAGGGYHDPGLADIAMHIARQNNLQLRQGVYCWTLGPTYETPAEIRKIRTLGADAVGMSTVPELRTAREL